MSFVYGMNFPDETWIFQTMARELSNPWKWRDFHNELAGSRANMGNLR